MQPAAAAGVYHRAGDGFAVLYRAVYCRTVREFSIGQLSPGRHRLGLAWCRVPAVSRAALFVGAAADVSQLRTGLEPISSLGTALREVSGDVVAGHTVARPTAERSFVLVLAIAS